MNKKIQRIAIIVLIIYVIASLYFLFAPVGINITDKDFPIPLDKVLHFFLFVPYPILFWTIIRYSGKNHIKQLSTYVWAFIISIAIGACTELAQKFLSVSREGNYMDFLADTAGIAFALLLLWIFEDNIDSILSKLFTDRKKTEQSAGMDK